MRADRVVDPALLAAPRSPPGDHRRPQLDRARPGDFAGMLLDVADHAEPRLGDRVDRGVDEFEDRPGRAEAVRQRQPLERQPAIVLGPVVVAERIRACRRNAARAAAKLTGSVPWKPKIACL